MLLAVESQCEVVSLADWIFASLKALCQERGSDYIDAGKNIQLVGQ